MWLKKIGIADYAKRLLESSEGAGVMFVFSEPATRGENNPSAKFIQQVLECSLVILCDSGTNLVVDWK